MKTVHTHDNINIKGIQEFIEKNCKKLGITEENAKKIIKSLKSKYVNREMRRIFFQECLKRMNNKHSEENGSYSHLSNEERVTIEILYTAGFTQNFIAMFLGRNRSTIGRELEKNVNEY